MRRSLAVSVSVGLLTNWLSAALIPVFLKTKDVITDNPPLTVTVTVTLFFLLFAGCLGFMHLGLNCYLRTGELRRFVSAALVAYLVIASFFLINNYWLPDTYCLPRTVLRILFICIGLNAGPMFGVLVYELERVTRHERQRIADRRILPIAHG